MTRRIIATICMLVLAISIFNFTDYRQNNMRALAEVTPFDDLMRSTYSACVEQLKKDYSGRTQFESGNGYSYGLCGYYVRLQLDILGIGHVPGGALGDGNKIYGNLTADAVTSSGYTQKKYPGSNCLDAIVKDYGTDVRNIVVSWVHQYGASTANPGAGHATFIYAIIDNMVYYTESFAWGSTPEGAPSALSLSSFKDRYNKNYGGAVGAVVFTKGSGNPSSTDDIIAYENCTYKMVKKGELKDEPRAGATTIRTLAAGNTITTDAIVDNGINYWGRITHVNTEKLSQPLYLFSGYNNSGVLDPNQTQYLQLVSSNASVDWVGRIEDNYVHTQGQNKTVGGTVTSDASIKSIKSEILQGSTVLYASDTVTMPSTTTKSFNLAGTKVDTQLPFGKLSVGSYYLKITVKYSYDRAKTLSCEFKVPFTVGSGSSAAASTLRITGVKYPSIYMYNNGGYGYVVDSGTVSSNYTLTKITTDIQNSSGKSITTGLPKTVTPSGTSYSISALNSVLPFSKISSAGTYYWIITATDSSGKSVTLKMPINAVSSGSNTIATGTTETTAVTGVSVDLDEVTLRVGQTTKLTATVSPSNATNKSVTWKSSNAAVATVSNGTVTAKAGGTATITCTTADGGYTASCKVTVTISPTGISLSPTTLTLEWGKTSTLTATISPSNATNKTVHWSTSNNSVVTVDNGVVKGVSVGTATITAMTEDGGYKATCAVTVKVSPTGVKLNASTTTLKVGNTTTLTATVSPSNATNKNVTWSSSNTSVATVSSGGVVTAKAAGTVTITCKTVDGGYTATCTVRVVNPVNLGDDFYAEIRHISSGKIIDAEVERLATVYYTNKNDDELRVWHFVRQSDGHYRISKGEYYMELAGGGTANNTDIRLLGYNDHDAQRWYIQKYSDGYRLTSKQIPSRCAQVSGNGTEDDGNVYLYDEGNTEAQCFAIDKVTLVESVMLDSSNISLYVNWTKTLTATVSPSTASNKSVIWSSDNTAVATVSSSGVVTGKSNGTATITCKTVDGGYTASCKVTVSTQVSGILLEPQVIALSPVNVRTGPSTSYEVITKLQTGDTLPYAGNKQADSDGTVWYKVTVNGNAGWMSSNLTEIQQNQTIIVDKGENVTLQYFIEPADATNKNVTWSSSNTSVATVNAAQVAAVAPGKTTITCTTHNGGYSATCTVVVYGEKKLVLPADLKMIESEAFRQLAIDTVILSPNTESIDSKAFADCDDLRIIYMPDSVVQIAEDAFDGSDNVCFVCESENAAATHAKKHSIPYVIE